MSANDTVSGTRAQHTERPSLLRRLAAALSFRNISAVYILAALFVIYSLWVPDTFLTVPVWRALIDSSALTALAAVGLVLPLAAGAFDLAIGAEVGMGAIVVAWLSGGQQLVNLGGSFQRVATDQLLGLTYPVWILIIVGLGVWYVLDRTAVGRRIYATGGNAASARLAGVRTAVIVVATLAACGAIAGLSGALVSSQLATGDPTIGPAYLLPAYASVFLGSTQFRGGRYNVWGTILAVYVLAIGVKGLQLGGAPVWIPDLFNGLALLLAVGLARFQRKTTRSEAVRRTLRRTPKVDPSLAVVSEPIPPVASALRQELS